MYEFMMAQINDSYQGDWWIQTRNNLDTLKIKLTLSEIKVLSKQTFKTKVIDSVTKLALNYLLTEKNKLSKVKCIFYKKLDIQSYFINNKLSIQQSKFLFQTRSRMLNFCVNYKGKFTDLYCQLCSYPGSRQYEYDQQPHLLTCPVLSSGTDVVCSTVQYDNIFSEDDILQSETTIILMDKYQQRNQLLSQLPDTN